MISVGSNMNSPCIREASEACFHGCSPFHVSSGSSHTHTHQASSFRSEFVDSIASSLHRTSPITNHESLPSVEDSFASFTAALPQFVETDEADRIRARDYHHLASTNHVCLDYIGHGLFSYAQTAVSSASAPSSSTQPPKSWPFFETAHKPVSLGALVADGGTESEFELKVRRRIMAFMNMREEDYAMVFTSSQWSAFKLLAESYPFRSNKKLLSVYDHESEAMELMKNAAKKRGARVKSAEFSWPKLRIKSAKLMKMLLGKTKERNQGLFVFPLQSRLSGSRYSYSWMGLAQEKGWHVLLDACALGPKDMETLGLSLFKPDFLICSFYKVFGNNPSGFACLFVKRSSASILLQDKGALSIGIVSLHHPTSSTELDDSGESEALSSSQIVQVKTPALNSEIEFSGLDHADTLGLVLINTRGRYLINWLVNALLRLEHPDSTNQVPLVQIYGPRVTFERAHAVAFNLFDWKGERVEPPLVQKLADRMGISLSYGFLKNMWVPDHVAREGEKSVEFQGMEMMRKRKERKMCVVSAALGFLTNFEDVYRVWAFVSRFLDADFVEKERWRYTALNQQMFEL